MRLVAMLLLVLPLFGFGAQEDFFSSVNAERAAVGLPAYEWNQDMAVYAALHNQEMVEADKIYHSTATQLGQFLGVRVAENVGRGGTVASLMVAFMDSPGHKAAILDQNYTEMGVAALQVGDRLYVTMVFRESVTEVSTPAPIEVRPAVQQEYIPAPHMHEQAIEPVVIEHVTLDMIPPHFPEGWYQ